MTYSGGINDYGVIFSYNINTSTFSKLYDFTGGANGGLPSGSLRKDANGNLVGMTTYYGNYNAGTLFSFNPLSTAYSKLLDFDGNYNGACPTGSVVQISANQLYAMTSGGGTGGGIIFSYNLQTNVFANKHNFNSSVDGSIPYGDLMLASDGNLYGMTAFGGDNGVGIIFKFDPNNYVTPFTKLCSFSSSQTGANPYGSLLEALDGNFYGMACNGGQHSMGTIFKFNPINSSITKIVDFETAKGSSPSGSLIQAADGMMYGLTSGGGNSNYGTLFQYNPNTGIYTVKHYFNNTEGRQPGGSLVEASDGNLYGLTTYGGANDQGVLFKYNPVNSSYTKLFDFKGSISGSNPKYTTLIEIRSDVSDVENYLNDDIEILNLQSSKEINIKLPESLSNSNIYIDIYNLFGEKLLSFNQINNSNLKIDLSHYPDGIYILKIQQNNKICIKKLYVG